MHDVSILADIEMPFIGREKALCVLYMLDHSRTRLCSMHLRESSQNSSQQQCRFGHGKKNSKRRVVCVRERIWTTKHIRRDGRECS